MEPPPFHTHMVEEEASLSHVVHLSPMHDAHVTEAMALVKS